MISRRSLIAASGGLLLPSLAHAQWEDAGAGNPFGFPSDRASGFDPTHPAAGGMIVNHGLGISGIATGMVITSLLTAQQGVITAGNAYTSAINGYIGPVVVSTTTSGYMAFNNQESIQISTLTAAAIIFPTSFTAACQLTATGASGGSSDGLGIATTGALTYYAAGAVNVTSTVLLTANRPYFVALSGIIGAAIAFISLDLSSGKVLSQSTTNTGLAIFPSSTVGLNGTQVVDALQGQYAAGMWSSVFLSQAQLLAWAADPWAFWYPRINTGLGGL